MIGKWGSDGGLMEKYRTSNKEVGIRSHGNFSCTSSTAYSSTSLFQPCARSDRDVRKQPRVRSVAGAVYRTLLLLLLLLLT